MEIDALMKTKGNTTTINTERGNWGREETSETHQGNKTGES